MISSHERIYQDFYHILEDKLQDSVKITQVSSIDINNEILNKHDLIISVGYGAAKIISEYKPKPTVIYSLIPDNKSLQTSIPCKNITCYKVYINQPVNRYIELFKALFPGRGNLAFASTQENTRKSQQLITASKISGISFKEIYIKQHSNIARTLINKLSKNDILLALPNPAIYNTNNAKSIILSAYHKNVPIIAYSKAFAKAGALASLYSSIDNIADKTASIAKIIIKDGHQLQKEYYPDDFAIKINSAVARSLNINIDSENAIKRKIK